MGKYLLSKNFSTVERQKEGLLYKANNVREREGKKDVTLYLNKTVFLF